MTADVFSDMTVFTLDILQISAVAVVADRALLAVFVIITVISTAAILLPQLNNLHVGNTPLKPPT
ncbi:Nicotinic acetylcholine receptor alpha 5 subunit [Operophtera brumata]|uniref:Nicotinic acetylcholine receptor alpha 5 subunit n=1 Tax=Operophtera brumata TaxID=104452 RepID=A0A0L7KSF8_OPEBR|nr:Nicotinic acetylcholine receptor alpha 5 subunit [Operophtera brumata]